MLTDELKQNTLHNHQIVEKKLIAKIRQIQSPEDYLGLLKIFYGYFGGLECLINTHLLMGKLPDYHLRRKADALKKDIEYLNGEIPDFAYGIQLPHIASHQDALGAMYVIEGSTLGGKIISQMIRKQLGISGGMDFFESYGDNTMIMWKAFQAILNQPENSTSSEIITAANETFLKFSEWFDLND